MQIDPLSWIKWLWSQWRELRFVWSGGRRPNSAVVRECCSIIIWRSLRIWISEYFQLVKHRRKIRIKLPIARDIRKTQTIKLPKREFRSVPSWRLQRPSNWRMDKVGLWKNERSSSYHFWKGETRFTIHSSSTDIPLR